MKERRRFTRWHVDPRNKAHILHSGVKEYVEILDVSAGGMKVCLFKSLELGTVIHGELKVLPHLGSFFVRGKVIRVTQKQNLFETVVSFDSVRTRELTMSFLVR
jgi:hypothetical protein